jgi:hypothetical protein
MAFAPTNTNPPSAFQRADPLVGLGGMGLGLALAGRRGIEDGVFKSCVAPFRREPLFLLGVDFAPEPRTLFLLSSLVDRLQAGTLPGTPSHDAGMLDLMAHSGQLWSKLPTYSLPAGECVSDADALALMERLAVANLSDLLNSASNPRSFAPWPEREAAPQTASMAPVTLEHVAEFAACSNALLEALLGAIPWGRQGPLAEFADAEEANQRATAFLGMPVDLRRGALVLRTEISDAIRRAAGGVAGNAVEARFAAHVAGTVPQIRDGSALQMDAELGGAAWSVAVDDALDSPAVWCGPEQSEPMPPARAARRQRFEAWQAPRSAPQPGAASRDFGTVLADADIKTMARA